MLTGTKRYLERMCPTLYVMRYGLGISLDDVVDMVGERILDRHRRKNAKTPRTAINMQGHNEGY